MRVQLAWTLLVLLVLIPAIVAVTRLVAGRGLRARAGKGAVRVLAALPLAPQRSVYVVDVDVRLLVLGATQSDVRLLTEIADPEEMARLRRALGADAPPDGEGPANGGGASSFDSFLAEVRSRMGKPRD